VFDDGVVQAETLRVRRRRSAGRNALNDTVFDDDVVQAETL